jgi:hypothetical protein
VSFASCLNSKHVSSETSHRCVFQETEGTANAAVIARLWSAASWQEPVGPMIRCHGELLRNRALVAFGSQEALSRLYISRQTTCSGQVRAPSGSFRA